MDTTWSVVTSQFPLGSYRFAVESGQRFTCDVDLVEPAQLGLEHEVVHVGHILNVAGHCIADRHRCGPLARVAMVVGDIEGRDSNGVGCLCRRASSPQRRRGSQRLALASRCVARIRHRRRLFQSPWRGPNSHAAESGSVSSVTSIWLELAQLGLEHEVVHVARILNLASRCFADRGPVCGPLPAAGRGHRRGS